jgi:hypothetical protein
MTDEDTLPCQVIRYMGTDRCVIRLTDTGAVIPITLATPLDAARAAFVNPLAPANARVRLGAFRLDWFEGCTLLDMELPPPFVYPMPRAYKKRKR